MFSTSRFTVNKVSVMMVALEASRMAKLNLSAVLSAKRREKGVTQEELARHVGVSKASVSKWEKGVSFPDITHLPILAAYFGITIDELVNYSPMLSDEEIAKIYTELAGSFAAEPFEEVFAKCESLAKKYYPCHKFLFYIIALYLNHVNMLADEERKNEVLEVAMLHCEHLRRNSRDANLLRDALHLQGLAYLMLGKPEMVFEILQDDEWEMAKHGDRYLISQAHQALGNMEKANESEQVSIFEGLFKLFHALVSYARLNLDDYDKAKAACERASSIGEMFNIKRLNVNAYVQFLLVHALVHYSAGEGEKAVSELAKFADTCISHFFPFKVRGDDFFDKIQARLDKSTKNAPLPRSEAVIKESMLADIFLSPMFEGLHDDAEFKQLKAKLKLFVGGN